jgi:hypothetical protein
MTLQEIRKMQKWNYDLTGKGVKILVIETRPDSYHAMQVMERLKDVLINAEIHCKKYSEDFNYLDYKIV